MKFIVIGLGNYGKMIVEELSALKHEVIGVDSNEHRVNAVKDKISVAYILDVTENDALTILPLHSVDAVLVCIGENLENSIRVVSLLKKNKVAHIFARAIDSTHKAILEAFAVDRILTPEEDAARNLVQMINVGFLIDSMKIDDEYYIYKFKIPNLFINMPVSGLELNVKYNLKIIALLHPVQDKNMLDVSYVNYRTIMEPALMNERMKDGDKLVCIGKYSDFYEMLSNVF